MADPEPAKTVPLTETGDDDRKASKPRKGAKSKAGSIQPLAENPETPRPKTQASREATITATDGVCLYWRRYEVAEAKGTVVVVHGFGEHSGLWEHVGLVLQRSGYEVVIYDQRGYGQSEGKRGHMPSITQSVRDLNVIISHLVRTQPAFLYGHSSGSIIALQYAIRLCQQRAGEDLKEEIEDLRMVGGVIASAPYLRLTVDIPRWQKRVIKLISKTYKSYTIYAEMEPAKLTHDVEMQKIYSSDPLVMPHISAKQLTELDQAAKDSLKSAHKMTNPLLIIHGSDDAVTDYKASEEFVNKAGSKDKDFNLVWGFFHDLHMEKDRKRVFDKIINWCDEHLSTAAREEAPVLQDVETLVPEIKAEETPEPASEEPAKVEEPVPSTEPEPVSTEEPAAETPKEEEPAKVEEPEATPVEEQPKEDKSETNETPKVGESNDSSSDSSNGGDKDD